MYHRQPPRCTRSHPSVLCQGSLTEKREAISSAWFVSTKRSGMTPMFWAVLPLTP